MSDNDNISAARPRFVLAIFVLVMAALMWRVVDLQLLSKSFLQQQGDARYLRVVTVPASRGTITDRYGEPLAVSTPVDSVWANPRELMAARDRWKELARGLDIPYKRFEALVERHQQREFVYLRRRVHPGLAGKVMALQIPGVSLQREFRRYYPAGEVTAHVLGFTNVDDAGQEGLELAYDHWLLGEPGTKRVIKDRLGRIVENVENIRAPVHGRNLMLSIDRRLQYLAYRELKAAVRKHKAKSGSVVVLDARTGEVLAMANQPAYNPNNRGSLRGDYYRNRAVTDVFEPGSTIKPFTIGVALASGKYSASTVLNTSPGYMRVGRNTIRDIHNYGSIDVTTVIQKSSNVGTSKIALSLEPEKLWEMFSGVGFGVATGTGFPGEASGVLPGHWRWHSIDQATIAFGYGLSVTPLQLARAYMVLAADGELRPVTFEYQPTVSEGIPVMTPEVARQVRTMLETVVNDGGTGQLARVAGYRTAGKTGTVRKSGVSGYQEDRYTSMFAGMVPATNPRLVMVVTIDEPSAGDYYGGVIAAPVFASVMAGALRLLDSAPDDLNSRGRELRLRNAAASGDDAPRVALSLPGGT
ncbi:MAG: cell division protein FtsI (penicillin-binding protein 3) [Gammaproteobacteria bacterium]|nr:MAG: cell division protein FtsI (penicillin-binding protein 3) [Gammaproteobacteria bacterium]TND02693.1 MAG: cell division protein FtsI (penicillin-binding protein 3) [Gammaproteobacteria bacterium]